MALSVIQSVGTYNGSGTSGTVVLNFSPTTAGNLVVLGVFIGDGTSVINSVNDSGGNIYSPSLGPAYNGFSFLGVAQYYAVQQTGAVTSATVVQPRALSGKGIIMFEIAGAASSSIVDRTSIGTNTPNVGSMVVNSFNTTNPDDIVIGIGVAGNNNITSWTAGQNYTLGGTTRAFAGEYRILSGTSSETAPLSYTPSTSYLNSAVAYKAQAAQTTTPANLRSLMGVGY